MKFYSDLPSTTISQVLKPKLSSKAEDVIKIMKSAPLLAKEHNGSKGLQLEYTLMPLATIAQLLLKQEWIHLHLHLKEIYYSYTYSASM